MYYNNISLDRDPWIIQAISKKYFVSGNPTDPQFVGGCVIINDTLG